MGDTVKKDLRVFRELCALATIDFAMFESSPLTGAAPMRSKGMSVRVKYN